MNGPMYVKETKFHGIVLSTRLQSTDMLVKKFRQEWKKKFRHCLL